MAVDKVLFSITVPAESQQVSTQALIDSIHPPFSEQFKRSLISVIDNESKIVEDAFRRTQLQELEETRSNERVVQSKLERARLQLEDAKKELLANDDRSISLAKAVIFMICFVACYVAEFDLTWVTLPFILNVEQYSFLGVLLGMAPATAPIILDVVIERLLEKPWRQVKQIISRLGRASRLALMAAFLAAIGLMNVYTVILMAEAREEASKIRQNLERNDGDAEIVVNQKVLRNGILAVSVCVTLDGALFFLLGMQELRGLYARRKSLFIIEALSSECEALGQKLAEMEAQMAVKQRLWEQIDERAREYAALFRARLLLQLEQAISRIPQRRPHRDVVDDIFARSLVPKASTNLSMVKPLAQAIG